VDNGDHPEAAELFNPEKLPGFHLYVNVQLLLPEQDAGIDFAREYEMAGGSVAGTWGSRGCDAEAWKPHYRIPTFFMQHLHSSGAAIPFGINGVSFATKRFRL
jgi:hypothetical protein